MVVDLLLYNNDEFPCKLNLFFVKLHAHDMIDRGFVVCFHLCYWMTSTMKHQQEMDGNRHCYPVSFFIAHSVLTFVPFDSASASICTWLSVFQSYHWKPDFYFWRFTSTFSSISTSYSSENFSKYTDLEIFEVCFCLYLKTLQLFLRDKYLTRHGEDYRPLRYMIRHFYRL